MACENDFTEMSDIAIKKELMITSYLSSNSDESKSSTTSISLFLKGTEKVGDIIKEYNATTGLVGIRLYDSRGYRLHPASEFPKDQGEIFAWGPFTGVRLLEIEQLVRTTTKGNKNAAPIRKAFLNQTAEQFQTTLQDVLLDLFVNSPQAVDQRGLPLGSVTELGLYLHTGNSDEADQSAFKIGAILAESASHLRKLRVEGTKFGPKGETAYIKGLSRNSTLISFHSPTEHPLVTLDDSSSSSIAKAAAASPLPTQKSILSSLRDSTFQQPGTQESLQGSLTRCPPDRRSLSSKRSPSSSSYKPTIRRSWEFGTGDGGGRFVGVPVNIVPCKDKSPSKHNDLKRSVHHKNNQPHVSALMKSRISSSLPSNTSLPMMNGHFSSFSAFDVQEPPIKRRRRCLQTQSMQHINTSNYNNNHNNHINTASRRRKRTQYQHLFKAQITRLLNRNSSSPKPLSSKSTEITPPSTFPHTTTGSNLNEAIEQSVVAALATKEGQSRNVGPSMLQIPSTKTFHQPMKVADGNAHDEFISSPFNLSNERRTPITNVTPFMMMDSSPDLFASSNNNKTIRQCLLVPLETHLHHHHRINGEQRG